VHFDAVFNRQKTRIVAIDPSLGTRILRFNRETMLTKTVQKLSKNSRSDEGGHRGSRTTRPPSEYATAYVEKQQDSKSVEQNRHSATLHFLQQVTLYVHDTCETL